MSLVFVGILIVVAAAMAALGQFLTGYSRGGCPVSFIVAIFGTAVGPYAAGALGIAEPVVLPVGDVRFPLVTSAAAALILVVLVNLATRHRKF
jgi:hypothetical protein